MKKEYFEEHPTVTIGIQSYGKSFGEVFTPMYLKDKPNESTESFLTFIETINPGEEEYNGTLETQEKEESSNNLS